MAYADNKMSSSRIAAIAVVALLHALLGYAFVTGLAFNVVKKVAQDLKTFNVEEPPPPEEEPPPPPPEVVPETPPPPVVSPPPLVRLPSPPPPVTSVNTAPPAPPTIPLRAVPAPPAPPAPPPPPPPPPPKVVQAAQAKGSLAGLISTNDYPSSAVRGEEEGTVRVRLGVGTNGRVTSCEVVQSSGSSALDSATCRIIRSRARFTPAKDNNGNPIADTVTSPSITWRLE